MCVGLSTLNKLVVACWIIEHLILAIEERVEAQPDQTTCFQGDSPQILAALRVLFGAAASGQTESTQTSGRMIQ